MFGWRVNVPDDCFEHGGIHEVRDHIDVGSVRDHSLVNCVQYEYECNQKFQTEPVSAGGEEVIYSLKEGDSVESESVCQRGGESDESKHAQS